MDIQKPSGSIGVYCDEVGNLLLQYKDIWYTFSTDKDENLCLYQIKKRSVVNYTNIPEVGPLHLKISNNLFARLMLEIEKEELKYEIFVPEDLYYIIPPFVDKSIDEDDGYRFYGSIKFAPFRLRFEALYQFNLVEGEINSSKILSRSYHDSYKCTRIMVYSSGEIKLFVSENSPKIYNICADNELSLKRI